MAVGGERIDPGLDTEQVQAQLDRRELGQPQVVTRRLHRHAVPVSTVGLAPVQQHHQLVMAVAVDLAADLHRLAADGLGGEGATVEHRACVFDHQTWRQQRLRQADGLFGVVVGHGYAFEGLAARHRTVLPVGDGGKGSEPSDAGGVQKN